MADLHREIEWALIQGETFDSSIPSLPLHDFARLVVDSRLEDALKHPLSTELLTSASRTEQQSSLTWPDFKLQSCRSDQDVELARLVLGIATLHAFVQVNWTGPDLGVLPSELMRPSSLAEDELNRLTIAELSYGGEPAYHLAKMAAYLRIAQKAFDYPFKHIRSAPWWQLRVSRVHQTLLDEPVEPSTAPIAALESLRSNLADKPELAGRLILELGLWDHLFRRDKAAAQLFVNAAQATGLAYDLTGALGKRTKFQQTYVPQLVLLAESHMKISDEAATTSGISAINGNASQSNATVPETLALNDDTLLERTEFTSSSTPNSSKEDNSLLARLDPNAQPPLHPLDQCIFLAMCLNVKNTSPSHGLTNEQMSPYVARVIAHPRNWSVHTVALLLRSRLESTRTRTVERSTLQLQALIDQMPTADSSARERLAFFHALPLPSKWALERELANRFQSIGVVRSALEIYERLELWEEVVHCRVSMERTDRAIEIVRDLLEGRKEEADTVVERGKDISEKRRSSFDAARQAKLWCMLGELEPTISEAHFRRAWEVSGETSGRAMRSLGGYHFARNEFEQSVECLRRAATINPLQERTWFILGCALVRLENWNEAKDAFVRCISINDEDGESWNNLASVYLRLPHLATDDDDEPQAEGVIPFKNKMAAFRALKQGLRHSYENWRMWSNYLLVAIDVGELPEACRALGRIIEQRAEKDGERCVDVDALDRLVDAAVTGENDSLRRPVAQLFERTILPRVSSPRILRAHARLLTSQERWREAVGAYLAAWRAGTGGSVEAFAELDRWREAVRDVTDLVGVLQNFGPRAEAEALVEHDTSSAGVISVGGNWRLQARSVVRSFIARSRDFEEEAEYATLLDLQNQLRPESDG